MIPFNKPIKINKGTKYIREAIRKEKISGDGCFTKKCSCWIEKKAPVSRALLTTSGTHALEMAAFLIDIKPGDEVIMPSYTFSSTANAFVLRGAKIVFVDIHPETMNIDEKKIEEAISSKTKAMVVMHYAGVACEMDSIMAIAEKHNLYVIEDAAQAVMSTYKGKPLGSIGHIGCFSFHETKNYTMGEGGALLLRDDTFVHAAEIIREKGTNRSQFYRGEIDKYSWVDQGSSYLPSEINAAYLWAQLNIADKINNNRLSIWNTYYSELSQLKEEGFIELPCIPAGCIHNAHMFYIKIKDIDTRQHLINYLKQDNVLSVFHYIPLHSAKAGLKYGVFRGKDVYTTSESKRLLRLPLYYGMRKAEVKKVCRLVKEYFYENH